MGPRGRSSAMEAVSSSSSSSLAGNVAIEREGQRSLVALLLSVELQISSRIFQPIHEAVLWNST